MLKSWLVVSLLACMAAPALMSQQKQNDAAAVIRNLDIFNSVYKELNTFYVDTLNAQKSIEVAISSMLNDIDPYTEYYPADNQDELLVISSGEYGGIGSYIMQRKSGGVYISGPYEDSPANRAGLRMGDRIIMIDGDTVKDMPNNEVSKRLKGQVNTQVTVTVQRPYDPDSLKTFVITREKIKLNPVPFYGVARDGLGYINLATFNEHAAEGVKKAIEELRKNPAVKYIVLDVRGNGGGLLEEAVKIVGFFVPKGTEVLHTKGRSIQNFKVYKTTEEPIAPKIPLVVMIDGATASSSEITAGALQDLDRAVVIGSRSFGKGLVQATRQLPYGGLMKVTIAKYYIPSGRLIQEIDYSHRNADGSAMRVADSLATVYHTAHGREVRGGGGITPDVKIDYPEMNRLVYNIVRDNWAFDFATKYAAEHPTVPAAKDFRITDEIFNDFKAFIDPKKFDYDKVCEQGLETLKKTAELEGYMDDSTKAEFARLSTLLKHDLEHDLDNNRKSIETLLSSEIMKRYYFDRGEIENSLIQDKTLDKALEIFTTPGEYERILNLGAKAAKSKKTLTAARRPRPSKASSKAGA